MPYLIHPFGWHYPRLLRDPYALNVTDPITEIILADARVWEWRVSECASDDPKYIAAAGRDYKIGLFTRYRPSIKEVWAKKKMFRTLSETRREEKKRKKEKKEYLKEAKRECLQRGTYAEKWQEYLMTEEGFKKYPNAYRIIKDKEDYGNKEKENLAEEMDEEDLEMMAWLREYERGH